MFTINTLLKPAIPSPLHFSKPHPRNQKPLKPPHLCCFRTNGDVSGLSKPPSPMESGGHDNAEMSEEQSQSSNVEQDMKHNDIWRLFREAKQNILYLNKQRLAAVEELNKANQEKQLLLDKIQQLEAEKQEGGFGKDKLSICWELLHRIDSMVFTGLINTQEASDLRKLVLDYKVSVADVFTDVFQKRDADLLAELHHFSNGSKK